MVFAREGTLWAVPFDRTGLAVTGPEFPILEGVSQALNTNSGSNETGAAQFAVSRSGSLAYIAGSVAPDFKREIILVDRDGRTESIGIEPARYHIVRSVSLPMAPEWHSTRAARSGPTISFDVPWLSRHPKGAARRPGRPTAQASFWGRIGMGTATCSRGRSTVLPAPSTCFPVNSTRL